MTWNYRVIKTIHGDEISLAIHEVFYNDTDDQLGWSADPVPVFGETKEDLLQTIAWMTAGINKPHLIEKDGQLVEES